MIRLVGADETLLVPDAVATLRFVESIAAVVVADRPDNRRPAGEGELFDGERVIVAPVVPEFVHRAGCRRLVPQVSDAELARRLRLHTDQCQ